MIRRSVAATEARNPLNWFESVEDWKSQGTCSERPQRGSGLHHPLQLPVPTITRRERGRYFRSVSWHGPYPDTSA
jgi:hypothetical protein